MLIPGTGRTVPRRYTTRTPIVNRMRSRSSLTRKMSTSGFAIAVSPRSGPRPAGAPHFAAECDDLRPRRGRDLRHVDHQLPGEVPVAEQLHGHDPLAREALLAQRLGRDGVAVGEPVQVSDVDDLVDGLERHVGEPAPGDAPVQRHLAALEAEARAAAGAGPLALGAPARGLAVPRAEAPAEDLLRLLAFRRRRFNSSMSADLLDVEQVRDGLHHPDHGRGGFLLHYGIRSAAGRAPSPSGGGSACSRWGSSRA